MESGEEVAVRIEDAGDRRLLRVEGPMDVANGITLSQALRGALDWTAEGAGRGATVDLAGVTAVDLCGLQILCSAHRTFQTRGVGLDQRGAPAWFRQTAAAAGFAKHCLECRYRRGGNCLWRE